jgi:hypothetical protein
MDIIEKETVKEVPVSYWEKHYGCNPPYGYGNSWNSWDARPFIPASRGVAGAGLGLN